MISKLLAKAFVNKLANYDKSKKQKEKKKNTKREHKEMMIRVYGKTRYYLSFWFGTGMLYAFNNKRIPILETVETKKIENTKNDKSKSNIQYTSERPYQKFYKDEYVAKRYEKMLKRKYRNVHIENVYGESQQQKGYLLVGVGRYEQEVEVTNVENVIDKIANVKPVAKTTVKTQVKPQTQMQPQSTCEFCGGEDIYIQGTKSIIPCPKCKRNSRVNNQITKEKTIC